MNRFAPHLGEPDLRLAGFRRWVHAPPAAASRTSEDRLNVPAHRGAAGAGVWAHGEILQLGDVAAWLKQTGEMHRTLSGAAHLSPLEPGLSVAMATGAAGRVEMEAEITPDPANRRHRFPFALDPSYLPAFLARGRRLPERLAPGAAANPLSSDR